MNLFTTLLPLVLPSIWCIKNDHSERDSFMSAYLDLQSSTEPPAGVIYAEPVRPYGPPQTRPLVYYGPPSVHTSFAMPAMPTDFHHSFAPEYSYTPVTDILTKLAEKLEFLPKLIAGFLGVTKVLLKVVLLKMILKFIIMFCLFFFLPKLEILDAATNADLTNTMTANNNDTGPHTPAEELEEGRLNSISSFVFDSIENRPFLRRHCYSDESTIKCKIMKTLAEFEKYTTIPRLLETFTSNQA